MLTSEGVHTGVLAEPAVIFDPEDPARQRVSAISVATTASVQAEEKDAFDHASAFSALRRHFGNGSVISDMETFRRAYLWSRGQVPCHRLGVHPYMDERLAADLDWYREHKTLPPFLRTAYRVLISADSS